MGEVVEQGRGKNERDNGWMKKRRRDLGKDEERKEEKIEKD